MDLTPAEVYQEQRSLWHEKYKIQFLTEEQTQEAAVPWDDPLAVARMLYRKLSCGFSKVGYHGRYVLSWLDLIYICCLRTAIIQQGNNGSPCCMIAVRVVSLVSIELMQFLSKYEEHRQTGNVFYALAYGFSDYLGGWNTSGVRFHPSDRCGIRLSHIS